MFRPDHIGFARIDDDRVVYLDTCADRYGCLSPALSHALLDNNGSAGAADIGLGRLLGLGLLDTKKGNAIWPVMVTPARSALDESGSRLAIPWSLPIRLATIGWRLRNRGLHASLSKLRRDRLSHHLISNPAKAAALARSFDRRRARVPIERICLPDGLLLSHILLDLGISSQLVFGVRLDPFSAHCWVEADGLILSDGADRIREFTPIYCA